ncbi:hypothetical protein JKA74_08540 [Marivirga sp. S37H4]|uniref:Uncharacterized protein n=1 Tax=Marivirga aurantiaca TaxID=2802615 RepID=A0A934WY03_9BACT|nr:hypothetical protein [Marivirga aurantiaca]MBK6265084.1 hypothetical protein [Marivirga aurantiaca]
MRKIHYLSGLTFSVFILLHLFNHLFGFLGADKHIELMNTLRLFYRNPIAEIIFLAASLSLIVTGIKLFRKRRKLAVSFFEKLHLWSGLYLAFFLLNHIGAVLGARFFLQLDTNFYFGAAGLNTFPFNIFFIPYYSLAIISFFAHISSIHQSKMKQNVFGITPVNQSRTILIFGIVLSGIILLSLTNNFKGIHIPEEYDLFKLLSIKW